MGEITALKQGKTRRKRIHVFLDGRFAFSLEQEAVVQEGLQLGMALSPEKIETLTKANGYYLCMAAALRFLSYRPRSEFETRERLRQHGFAGADIDTVVAKLKEQRLLDDAGFARFWQENRTAFRPRSQWLVKQELRQKGVAADTAVQISGLIDDGEMAFRAGSGKARQLAHSGVDHDTFRRRLGDYLRRRGFAYGTISPTIAKLWQELTETSDDTGSDGQL